MTDKIMIDTVNMKRGKMSNLLDKICKIRDLMISKKYEKFKFFKMEMLTLKEELHRQISKKTKDFKHELDFTSQDLRELAQDIRGCLKDWQDRMNPENNIKYMVGNKKNNTINFDWFYDQTLPIMTASTESVQAMYELLNIVEYHATFLYMLEEASEDKFALELTERF